MKIHVNISVSGKVQKIGFRFSTQEVANQLNIYGFVQNLPDGKVYIEAEGDEDEIEKFIEWCHSGPPWARVDNVTIGKGILQEFEDFVIRRD